MRRKMMHGHFCNVKPTSAHNASLITCLPAYLLCGCVNPLVTDGRGNPLSSGVQCVLMSFRWRTKADRPLRDPPPCHHRRRRRRRLWNAVQVGRQAGQPAGGHTINVRVKLRRASGAPHHRRGRRRRRVAVESWRNAARAMVLGDAKTDPDRPRMVGDIASSSFNRTKRPCAVSRWEILCTPPIDAA